MENIDWNNKEVEVEKNDSEFTKEVKRIQKEQELEDLQKENADLDVTIEKVEKLDKNRKLRKEKDAIKEFWLKKYSKDKIGTIAKLSQAMQHMAWLREWKRVHGNEPRIKPITQKVNGEKVKIGESNIAVPWSKLHPFFRQSNEYGDIETVKFLSKRIQKGDISKLTAEELYKLSEQENVKWSDGKHSLNPFQGYLYAFMSKPVSMFDGREVSESYGNFNPIAVYKYDNNGPTDCRFEQSLIEDAYSRVFAVKLIKRFLQHEGKEENYKKSLIFNITDVITPEQIMQLDKEIVDIVHSSRFKYFMDDLEGNAEYERNLENEIKKEIEIEIKKDSDRIENAYKIFVALEKGNLDELLEDKETMKWAREVYKEEMKINKEQCIEEN